MVVTAGPTREPIDPVRFISNRSSGKMGYAVARAALRHGHDVVLISGPVCIAPPEDAKVVRVETAIQMMNAVMEHLQWCDALVMAAAVADWRPAQAVSSKIKKRAGDLVLKLERNPDILAAVRGGKGGRTVVGFAAETHNLLREAKRKLELKGLDLVVANNVLESGSGFDVDTNKVTLIDACGEIVDLPLMTKDDVAERIVEWIERRRRISRGGKFAGSGTSP